MDHNAFQPELTPELTGELNGLFELAVNLVSDQFEEDAAPTSIDRYAREQVLAFVHNYLEGLSCAEF